MRRSAPRRNDAGFSLIEIVVAFALVAAVLVVLLPGFATSLGGAEIARRHQTALAFAESKLAETATLARLTAGTESGDFAEGFAWRREIRRADSTPPVTAEEAPPVRVYRVSVIVSWGAGDGSRVELATLVLGPEPGR